VFRLPWDRRLACPALACHMGHADKRAVLKQTIAADRCSIWNRSHPSDANVCMPILISTGETPNRPREKMVWYSLREPRGTGGVLQNTAGIESYGVVMRTGQAGRLSHDGQGQAGRLSHGTASAEPNRIATAAFVRARPITRADLTTLTERVRRRVIRGPHGHIRRVRYRLPRHKAANWVGAGRKRTSTRPAASGARTRQADMQRAVRMPRRAATTHVTSPARTTPRGSPGRNRWPFQASPESLPAIDIHSL